VPDLVFLHNPEHGNLASGAVEKQLLPAFQALEEACDQGFLDGYGVATWTALHSGVLSLERLLDLAQKAGGTRHRLRAIQLPLSLVHITPISEVLAGYGVLAEARAAGLDVYASAPLHGGELVEILTPTAADQLVPGASPLRIALGTIASSPGVTRILISASSAEHWSSAAAAVTEPPLTVNELQRISDAFAP
jgi:aryl-alcohol dehydrogenase-like predicted oxidoreductase